MSWHKDDAWCGTNQWCIPHQSQTLTDGFFPDLWPLGHLASKMFVPLSSDSGCMAPHTWVAGMSETLTHGPCGPWLQYSDTHTQRHVHKIGIFSLRVWPPPQRADDSPLTDPAAAEAKCYFFDWVAGVFPTSCFMFWNS